MYLYLLYLTRLHLGTFNTAVPTCGTAYYIYTHARSIHVHRTVQWNHVLRPSIITSSHRRVLGINVTINYYTTDVTVAIKALRRWATSPLTRQTMIGGLDSSPDIKKKNDLNYRCWRLWLSDYSHHCKIQPVESM